jgi:outer membrane protein OmpA-like peptidoglycan-associated protein
MEQGAKISEKSGTNNEVTETYRLDKNKLLFGLVVDLKLANRIKKQRKAKLAEMEAKVDTLTTIVNTPVPAYDDSALVARIDSIEQQLAQKPVPNQLNESSLETDLNEQGVRYFKDFKHVAFPKNSSYFNRNSYANLFFKLTSFLEQNPNVRLQLVGYADGTGTAAYNLAISKRRANRVRDHLVNTFGIAPSRIETIGAGETQKFSISNSMENRRTEIIILQD